MTDQALSTTAQTADDAAPRQSFVERNRNVLLGLLAVVLFFAAWQAVFLFVPFNPLFISKPTLWDPLESTCRHASLSIL